MSVSGTEIKSAFKKTQLWNVPEVCGANDGILILPTSAKRDAGIIPDDSLGEYFSKDGIPGPIKVEFDLPMHLRYDSLDVPLALFMGIAGAPVQQGGTSAYSYTYKWKNNLDGLFLTFVGYMKAYIREIPTAKVSGITIKSENMECGFSLIASNLKTIPSRSVVEASINVGTIPIGIEYCLSNRHLYVTNNGAGTVNVIDPGTNLVTTAITVGANPYGVVYCSSNNRVYVTNSGAGTVSVIDPTTNSVAATINVGGSPYGVVYCPSNNSVYVANDSAGTVNVIDPGTNLVATAITVGANPYGVVYCSSNNRVYVTNSGAGTVSVINPTTNSVAATITIGGGVYGLVYSQPNNRIYVANFGTGTVIVINPDTNTVVSTITIGANPYNVGYCLSNNRVYIVNYSTGTVTVINPNTNTIVTTITVGVNPLGFTYCPLNNRLYVGICGSNTIIAIIPESNTLSTFNSVTYSETANRIKFSDGVFRINNQTGSALADTDRVYPSSFELAARRKLKGEYTGEYKTFYPNVQDIIDEPCNDGMPEITLKLTFPRHTSASRIGDLHADVRKKLDITFTGALIEGTYYRQFKMQFPHLQLKDVPVVDSKGNIQEPVEFIVHGCTTAPAGMTGLTDPFWISGINRRSTDPLA